MSWVRLPVWVPGRPAGAVPPPGQPARSEPPFRSTSWAGALLVMLVLVAAVWAVHGVNAAHGYSFVRFGLRPRRVDGLWGVLTQPVLHRSWSQLVSDTVPLLGLGWVLLLSGVRAWCTVTAAVVVAGGLAAWLVAPSGPIVGSAPLAFGWLAYLVARAWFARKVLWIVAAVAVLAFFGTLLGGLLPGHDSGSWPANLCGFLAGIGTAAALHPRRRPGRPPPPPPVVS